MDWDARGSKIKRHPERAFGPILFSQYTLSGGVLKMTAQMPPLGERDGDTVRLEVMQDGKWKIAGNELIHPQARTATFRVENWDATRDVPYRLSYVLVAQRGQGRLYDRHQEREDERVMSDLRDHSAPSPFQSPDFFNASATSGGM